MRGRDKDLRIRSHWGFVIFRWLTRSSKTIKYVMYAEDPKNIDVTRSSVITYNKDVHGYLDTLVDSIPKWNILSDTDSEFNNNAIAICLGRRTDNNMPLCVDGVVERSSALCHALGRLYVVTDNKSYLDAYKKLLSGIDMCIINNDKIKGVRRTPVGVFTSETLAVSEEVLSGLLLLISGFGNIEDSYVKDFEFSIRSKLTSIIVHYDYMLYSTDSGGVSDIKPTYIYTAPKCFAYMAIRLAKGKYNPSDARILREVLLTPIYINDMKTRPCRCSIISCVNLLYSIFNMYNSTRDVSGTQILSKLEFVKLTIAWILCVRSYYKNSIPEIDSVLAVMYSYLNDKDLAIDVVKGVQSVINVMYDNKVVSKNNINRHILRGRWHNTERTPTTRCPWCGDPVDIAPIDEEYSAIEYIICYSRIMHLVIKK